MTDESQDMNSLIRRAAGVEGHAGDGAQVNAGSESREQSANGDDSLQEQVDSMHKIITDLLEYLKDKQH